MDPVSTVNVARRAILRFVSTFLFIFSATFIALWIFTVLWQSGLLRVMLCALYQAFTIGIHYTFPTMIYFTMSCVFVFVVPRFLAGKVVQFGKCVQSSWSCQLHMLTEVMNTPLISLLLSNPQITPQVAPVLSPKQPAVPLLPIPLFGTAAKEVIRAGQDFADLLPNALRQVWATVPEHIMHKIAQTKGYNEQTAHAFRMCRLVNEAIRPGYHASRALLRQSNCDNLAVPDKCALHTCERTERLSEARTP